MSSSKEGMVRGSVGLLSRAAIQVSLFVVTIVATRYLPISEFGSYSLASSLVLLSRNLFYVGPYEYLLKNEASTKVQTACFAANIGIALIATTVLLGFCLIAPGVFSTSLVSQVLIRLIPVIFLAAIAAWFEAQLLRQLHLSRYYVITILGEAVGAAVGIAMLVNSFGLMSLVAQAYARIFTLLLLYALGSRAPNLLAFEWPATIKVIRWSWSRYAAVFLNFTSNYGADFILGAFLSPVATGIYRASNRIVSALVDLFAQPLQKIVQTNVSVRVARGLPADDSWLQMFTGVAAIGWAALAGLAWLASDVLTMALGVKWIAAAPVVTIFCFVRAFGLLDATTTSTLICYDRQRFMLGTQFVIASLVIPTSWLLAPLGAATVAAGGGSVLVAMSCVYGYVACRISNVSAANFLRAIGTAIAPAVGTVAAMYIFWKMDHSTSAGIVLLINYTLAGSAGFAITMFMIRRRVSKSMGALGHTAHYATLTP